MKLVFTKHKFRLKFYLYGYVKLTRKVGEQTKKVGNLVFLKYKIDKKKANLVFGKHKIQLKLVFNKYKVYFSNLFRLGNI